MLSNLLCLRGPNEATSNETINTEERSKEEKKNK
jgi:hypothetical protein